MILALYFGFFNVFARSVAICVLIFIYCEIKDMNSKLINYKELYEKTRVQIGCSFRPG